jgi:uncharacterized protein YegP (UPF0339 family)
MMLPKSAFRCLMALSLFATAPSVLVGCDPDADYAETVEQDATQKSGRFEIFVGQDGQHYFHLLAGNGENVLRSEGYVSWSGAEKGIDSVQKNGVDVNNFDLLQAKNGQYYFNLLAQNGEIIGTSELYTTKSSATKAIGTVSGIIAKTVEIGAATTDDPRFRVFLGLNKKYYFHLRAKNGEIVLQSQGYKSHSSAQKGVESVRANGVDAARYEVLEAANGQHYFVLKAKNGKVIGVGETYSSKWAAEQGVETVVALLRSGDVAQQN